MLQFTNIQLIALFSAKLKINAGLSKKNNRRSAIYKTAVIFFRYD